MDINPKKTAVILIGTSKYTNDFLDILQVENNIFQLENIFKSQDILGVKELNIFKLLNDSLNDIVRVIKRVFASNYDTIIMYYSGHGFRYRYNELFLLTPDTSKETIEVSGLRFSIIKDQLDSSTAKQKILILDCCHSGIATMNSNELLTESEFQISGTYILCSCSHDSLSYFDAKDKLTFFTGEFIDLLRYGKPSQRSFFTMNDIFNELKIRLSLSRLPEPSRKDNFNDVNYRIFKNTQAIRKKDKNSQIKQLQEEGFWQSTVKINEKEAYENYIKLFPNGEFIDEAYIELKRLTGELSKKELKLNQIGQFDSIGEFTEFGLAPASRNGKYGYIDKNWIEIIPFMFDWASNFSDGTAEVLLDRRMFLIDSNGQYIKQEK